LIAIQSGNLEKGQGLYGKHRNRTKGIGVQHAAIPNGYMYLRPVRASGARPPLFCFFPGFPGASDLADSLPEDQPVYQFFYPALDQALKFPDIDELASSYIQDIRKIQVHGPYQLCGYSKGGLLAYEVARLLLTQGENVSFLALFETWHPKFAQNLTLRESAHFRFSYTIDRIKKYCQDLTLGEFRNFTARVREALARRVKLVGWRAARLFFQRGGRPVPKNMQSIEATAVLKDYIPKPYPNRFFLIRTEDKFEMRLNDQTFGWHKCAGSGVDILFVLGDHGTMKDKPYVQSLADKIAPYLAREGADRPHRRYNNTSRQM
jgi:thioesterase domain-containing protein